MRVVNPPSLWNENSEGVTDLASDISPLMRAITNNQTVE